MQLADLVEALASEVELVSTELSGLLDALLTTDDSDAAFLEILDGYNGQVERLGSAAEMAGFAGLNQFCIFVRDNAMAVAVTPLDEREPFRLFLAGWPALVIRYLRHIGNLEVASELVNHLHCAAFVPDEGMPEQLMEMLLMAPQSQEAFSADQPARQTVATPEDIELSIPADVEPSLLEGFLHEAPSQAIQLSALVRKLLSGDAGRGDIAIAKRVAHTLKGSASIIGIRGITTLAHHTEDILEYLEHRDTGVSRFVGEVLQDAAYCLEQMIGFLLADDERPVNALTVLQGVLDLANRIDMGELVGDAGPAHGMSVAAHARDDANGVLEELEKYDLTELPALAQAMPAAPTVPSQGTNVLLGSALRVPVVTIDELFRVSGEISVRMAAQETRLKQTVQRSRELLAQNLRVQKRLYELETMVDVRALTMMRARGTRGQIESAMGAFDPLEFDQYNELHNTAHALNEEAADARAMGIQLDEEISSMQSLQLQQQRLVGDLQHLVTSTRMTAVGTLASRLQRNVRSTCQATGKLAELVMTGTDIQIDGDVLNRLADPLLHVLRNAVDHGLEAPEARLAVGKPAVGCITLSFERIGQQAVVRCSDDGRGLDLVAVRQRAIEQGLITANQELTSAEVVRLVLSAGFSTRDEVTEVSGRGVGLDVVRDWAQSMNGSVQLESTPGQGCVIELRFQSSMTTMQSLIVEVAGQRFVLPSINVVRAVARDMGEFSVVAGSLMYKLDQLTYPALRLAVVAGLADDDKPIEAHDVVLMRVEGMVRALAVEKLVDARDLLIKDAGRFARHVRGIAGLSFLGDGSVAVVLDITQLLSARPALRHETPAALQGTKRVAVRARGVLIVDDSLSVRNSLSQMVGDAGYRVLTARDGLEAVKAIGDFNPDLVMTDLEMPNMNGLELTEHIRHRQGVQDLPVIMITSRSQEKHRQRANQAGVTAYITKPYSDADLLSTVRRVLTA